jgi:anti-sigma regulatory factor (Ser/Thr protein kinase)
MNVDVELPSSAEAPASARRAVGGLSGRVSEGRLRDVLLLVSELVTNAVRHATGEQLRLVVTMDERALRVEVHDRGEGFALRAPAPDPARPSGWGLFLVAELADRWGVDHAPRTRVWFEMDPEALPA